MSDIDTILLTSLLGPALSSKGISDDVLQTDAVSTVLGQLCDAINQATSQLQGKVQQQQQEAVETNKDVQQLIKVGKALTEALSDKSSPQPLPQQDMNAEPVAEPMPIEQPPVDQPPMEQPSMEPAPAAAEPMTMEQPPMEQPPADTAMTPAPDMMQIDPNMIGALQPRY